MVSMLAVVAATVPRTPRGLHNGPKQPRASIGEAVQQCSSAVATRGCRRAAHSYVGSRWAACAARSHLAPAMLSMRLSRAYCRTHVGTDHRTCGLPNRTQRDFARRLRRAPMTLAFDTRPYQLTATSRHLLLLYKYADTWGGMEGARGGRSRGKADARPRRGWPSGDRRSGPLRRTGPRGA